MGLALQAIEEEESRNWRDGHGMHGLTPKQSAFVTNLVLGNPPGKAAEMAGYSYPDQSSWRLTRVPAIQAAIRKESERILITQGVPAALGFMISAPADKKLPGAVRFQAAKWVMESAGHGLAAQRAALGLPGDDKPLDEMSVGELEAFLAAGQSAIAAIKARDGIIDGSARNVEDSTMGELAQAIDPKGDSAE